MSLLSTGCDRDRSQIIRQTGPFHLASGLTLRVFADEGHMLHAALEEPKAKTTIPFHIADTEPFVLYWHAESRTLWGASAKNIWSQTPFPSKGTLYDHHPDVLKLAPPEFQQEVSRTFP